MQSSKSYVAAIVAEPVHLSFASSRTPTPRVVGRQAAIYNCALSMAIIYVNCTQLGQVAQMLNALVVNRYGSTMWDEGMRDMLQ